VIGLDIGSSSVKMVELVHREDGLAMIRHEFREVGHSQNPAERESELLDALKALLRGIDRKRVKFVVSFNTPKTVMRILAFPPMPKAELKNALRLQAAQYLPFPVDEGVALEFETRGPVDERGGKKVQVVVVISPKKAIDQALAPLKKAGIRPASLVPVPLALQKLGGSTAAGGNRIRCLVEIGDRLTELVILKGRRLLFSRKISIGGRDFTQAMTGALLSDRGKTQLTWAEAEQMKREFGLPPGSGLEMIGDKISATQLLSMLRSPLEQLANEIGRCFDYYREETEGERIELLELFGRGALLKGLREYLAENLGVEVKMGDPVGSLKIQGQVLKPEEGFSQYAVAMGAALMAEGGINMLPAEIKEETQRMMRRATIKSATVAGVLILSFFYIGMKIQLGNFQKRIDVARLELQSLRFQLQEVETLRWARKLLAEEPYWEDAFKEISNMVPSRLYLTEFAMEGIPKRFTLKGSIGSLEKEEILSRFIRELEQGVFKEVRLLRTEEKEDRLGSEFELEGGVD